MVAERGNFPISGQLNCNRKGLASLNLSASLPNLSMKKKKYCSCLTSFIMGDHVVRKKKLCIFI